jgi:hypothetical protein
MKRILVALMVVGLSSGCASYMAVKSVNAERVLQLRAANGGIEAGIDLAGLTGGYLAAWGESPMTMAGATVVDALSGYALSQIIYDQDDDDKPTPAPLPTYNIVTGGGDVNIVVGSGGISQQYESENAYK